MSERTTIEWCDSTFNPWTGCTKVSPGCDSCYAEGWAKRSGIVQWGPHAERRRTTPANWRKPLQWNKAPFFECAECSTECRWRGECNGETCPACGGHVVPARRRVFCASLADVFDNEAPVQWRADLLQLIDLTPNLDWLLLTKRIGNVVPMLADIRRAAGGATALSLWPRPNVWIGATVVNQAEADRDIPKLLQVPARVRFLSVEPMLEKVDLTAVKRHDDGWTVDSLAGIYSRHHDEGFDHPAAFEEHGGGPKINWVIGGFESGPHARPGNPEWARSLRDQCASAGVAFLWKQNGEFASVSEVAGAGAHHSFEDGRTVRRVGKVAAGRLLDGVEHNGFPEVR